MRTHPVAALCEALKLAPISFSTLGTWPSPARRLEKLSTRLGVSVWLKEDGIAATQYGGNKPRKLELLLSEARTKGFESLVTVGALGSNQIVATALYGRHLGFDTHAIVTPLPNSARPSAWAIEMTLHAAASGAHLVPAEVAEVGDVLDDLLEAHDDRVYLITAGGSTPLGNLAFVAAAFELKQQVDAGALPAPDEIVVPLGTGGTAAGLAVGCALAGLPTRIVGVRAAGHDVLDPAAVERQVAALFTLLTGLGWTGTERTASPIAFVDDQLGAGYGAVTPAAEQAAALARELEGLSLEGTYSAKAMAALLARSADSAGKNVVYWQTSSAVVLPSVDPKQLGEGALPARLRDWLWPAGAAPT